MVLNLPAILNLIWPGHPPFICACEQGFIIIIIWTLQHSVACDDIKIVVKVAERNADRQHQNRVVKLRIIYM